MNRIQVHPVSAEEVEHGVAEPWLNGEPLMVGVHSLAEALAEVDRVLAGR
jgi:hypothetical protein